MDHIAPNEKLKVQKYMKSFPYRTKDNAINTLTTNDFK